MAVTATDKYHIPYRRRSCVHIFEMTLLVEVQIQRVQIQVAQVLIESLFFHSLFDRPKDRERTRILFFLTEFFGIDLGGVRVRHVV